MFRRIITALWGDIKGEELKKFSLLALGMMVLIGSYWPLKILKDSVFINIVGVEYFPNVKFFSLVFFFPLIVFYSRLLDYYSREKMIYVLVSLFAIGGITFSYYLAHPTIGVANETLSPTRYLGWLFYLYVESYASLLVSLYWSYINDVTTPESAKRGYGLITFASQFGGLLSILVGHYLARDVTQYHVSAPTTLAISIGLLVLLIGVVLMLKTTVSSDQLAGYQEAKAQRSAKKERVSFMDGITMIIARPYVSGILGLILCSDIFDVIMSFQMNSLVKSTYVSSGLVNRFLFDYGLIIQICACLVGLLGTSFFQRTFGIRACLVLYPALLTAGTLVFLFKPTLFVIAGLMVMAKSLSYAFNQPAKEVLYIPTSRTVRYKSKAWMDMFGKRLGKGSGSVINKLIGQLVGASGGVALVLVLFWSTLAYGMGSAFSKVTKENKVI